MHLLTHLFTFATFNFDEPSHEPRRRFPADCRSLADAPDPHLGPIPRPVAVRHSILFPGAVKLKFSLIVAPLQERNVTL